MQRVGLNQHPLDPHRLQQVTQSLDLASGVGGLGDRHAQALGVEAQLGDGSRILNPNVATDFDLFANREKFNRLTRGESLPSF